MHNQGTPKAGPQIGQAKALKFFFFLLLFASLALLGLCSFLSARDQYMYAGPVSAEARGGTVHRFPANAEISTNGRTGLASTGYECQIHRYKQTNHMGNAGVVSHSRGLAVVLSPLLSEHLLMHLPAACTKYQYLAPLSYKAFFCTNMRWNYFPHATYLVLGTDGPCRHTIAANLYFK